MPVLILYRLSAWAAAAISAVRIRALVLLSPTGPKSGALRLLFNDSLLAMKHSVSGMIGPPRVKPWVSSLNLGAAAQLSVPRL